MSQHPKFLARLQRWMQSAYNAVDYPLREFFALQRGAPNLEAEPDRELFADLPDEGRRRAEARSTRLLSRYHLNSLRQLYPVDLIRKNLYYLDLLETTFPKDGIEFWGDVRAADIGPSHWFYVRALHAFLTWYQCPEGRKTALFGFEPDAYRIYPDFHSRRDHARAHIQGLEQVDFLPERFLGDCGTFEVITQFFPFVFLEDHLAWGLPRRLFTPQRLIAAITESLSGGGVLLVVNQGEEEHQRQLELLKGFPIIIQNRGRFTSIFYRYEVPSWFILGVRS